MNKGDIARQAREKYGWEMPTLKLARIIYAENKLIYTNLEDARKVLRGIEGKAGKGDSGKYRRTAPAEIQQTHRPRNPYNLPESSETNYEPYKVPGKRVLVLSDIHLPYHSLSALEATFDYTKREDIDTIVLNGDTLDFHGLSRFVKDPKARSVAHELAAFKDFMTALRALFPKAFIIYKMGNHCERYDHFLIQKAHEIIGVDEFDFRNIIKARADGIEVVGDKRILKLGALNLVHGHEFGGSIFSPVNIARGLFLRGKVSAMQGHNHQTSEHTESNMNGEITTTYSVGCLCELHPAYLPINKWNHGFAIVDVDGEAFHVRNYRIHKGEVL